MYNVGIAWKIGASYGWGVYGKQIALNMAARRRGIPVLLEAPGALDLSPIEQGVLAPALRSAEKIEAQKRRSYAGGVIRAPMPVLHALGNQAEYLLGATSERPLGNHNHGLIFFEDAAFSAAALTRLRGMSSVIAGSSWNAEVLKSLGVDRVYTCLQGIDPTIYHPAPKAGLLRDRFVIFSGGKLEFRKGQDIVVAALRRFRERYPETLLLAAWHNFWANSMGVRQLAASPHTQGPPPLGSDGGLQTSAWLEANGLPPEATIMLPELSASQLARLMREADVGLFPNRCEGGTNLVAMECMACGVPTILSANTGHRDIMADGACVPLTTQGAVLPPAAGLCTQGWGESSVDEIVEALERVYQDRARAAAIGRRGAELMAGLSWSTQTERLFDFLELPKGYTASA